MQSPTIEKVNMEEEGKAMTSEQALESVGQLAATALREIDPSPTLDPMDELGLEDPGPPASQIGPMEFEIANGLGGRFWAQPDSLDPEGEFVAETVEELMGVDNGPLVQRQ